MSDPPDPRISFWRAPEGASGLWHAGMRLQLTRLWELVRPYRVRWVWTVGALVSSGLFSLVVPQTVRLAIDEALGKRDPDTLNIIIFVGVLVVIGWALASFRRQYELAWLSNRVVADLRQRTFRHLLNQPPSFFREHPEGELVSRLTADIDTIREAIASGFANFARWALVVVLTGLALLVTEPSLAWVMLGLAPLLLWAAKAFGRVIRHRARQAQDLLAEANSGLAAAVHAIEVVQRYRSEGRVEERYTDRIDRAFDSAMRVTTNEYAFALGARLLMHLTVILLLWVGSHRIVRGELSSGELASFLLYALLMTVGVGALAERWSGLQRAVGAISNVFELLAEGPAEGAPSPALELAAVEASLQLEAVRFHYPDEPEKARLDALSLRVEPGQLVALVGPAGAGKSTVVGLLQRVYQPVSGRILVGGQPLEGFPEQELHRLVGLVEQEAHVLPGTLHDNITISRCGASRDDVTEVAAETGLAALVEALPAGWETRCGEDNDLPSGLRQRIALTRALLPGPRVLVIDEPTRHLDAIAEAEMVALLRRLADAGRAILLCTNRPSTASAADHIVVLERGRAIERGTHTELLEHGEVYPRLAGRELAALRSVRLFRGLSGEEREALAGRTKSLELSPGQPIFAPGDEPDGLYLIAEGRVGLFRGERCLMELADGDYFGLVGLIDGLPRSVRAVALKPTRCSFLARSDYHELLTAQPLLAVSLTTTFSRILAGRVRERSVGRRVRRQQQRARMWRRAFGEERS